MRWRERLTIAKENTKKKREELSSGIWIRFSRRFLEGYQKISYFLLNKAWPVIKTGSVFCFFIALLGLITYQTLAGMRQGLTSDYGNLFGVLTTTVGTVVAIFFSFALIPLNQITTRYSPNFLKHVKNDHFFWLVFLCSAIALIYDAVFLLIGASFPIASAATELFVLEIFLLGLSVLHVIKLSNPYNSILMPAHKEIVGTFRKWIPRYYKHCVKEARKNFPAGELSGTATNMCLFKIDDKITNYIQAELLPIREVAIKAIRDLDLEQAKNAIQIMMSIVVNYLYSRREYYSDDEPLLYFLYTEYKLIAHTSNNELKLRLHPFIVDCWRQIGINAAMVKVNKLSRMTDNFNMLTTYPVLGLKDLCTLNLLEMDSYAPGKACDALADIGAQLMIEGYDNQAATIVEELKNISILADEHKIKNVSGSANYGIMRIYAAGVANRDKGSKDFHNYPYREINKSINSLLDTLLLKERNVYDNMVLSSFIGWLTDPFKGLNLSRISEYGIFMDGLTKVSLHRHLQCVNENIKSLARTLNPLSAYEDWYFSNQVIENIYRIILNLLSYINPSMAKDHILFYKNHPFVDAELTTLSETIIMNGLSVLCDLVKMRRDKRLFENGHMHTLFSLYLIILYEWKLRPSPELERLFKSTHERFILLLAEYGSLPETDSNDDLYKFYRLLVRVLTENGFNDFASSFVVPEFEYRSRSAFGSSESQYPETMMNNLWWIKRPGFQANGYYYNDVENKLKLDTTAFY